MISPQLEEQLDEVPVSKLAEYLCRRLELDEEETMLQIQFTNGRYQRMSRYLRPRAWSIPRGVPGGGPDALRRPL